MKIKKTCLLRRPQSKTCSSFPTFVPVAGVAAVSNGICIRGFGDIEENAGPAHASTE